MNYFKRALASITRRKLRSFILLLIVLILGNVMLSTLMIVQSVDGTKESMLRELPPVVSLDLDYEKLEELYSAGPVEFDMPFITFEDLERIEAVSSDYIKTYDYSSSYHIQTESLEPYTSHDEQAIVFMDGANSFSLKGVSNPNFALLEVEEAEIIEGRTFTEEEIENGSPVMILSRGLAETNDYMVGDIIVIESMFSQFSERGEQSFKDEVLELEFELIGILEYREIPDTGDQQGFSEQDFQIQQQNNTLLTNNRFVQDYTRQSMEIMRSEIEQTTGEIIGDDDYNPLTGAPVTYILNSSEEVGSFVRTAEATLDNEYYKFTTQEDNYKNIADPLESMRGVLAYAFYITLGSSIVVLALVLFGFMRDRRKEIGIYLALGEKKSRITAQMIIESVAVGLLGATLALVSGIFLASFISDMLLTEPQTDPYAVVMGASSYLTDFDYESILQNYQVGLNYISVALFYVTITCTIVAAQLIASVYILKFDPKKIMM